MSRRVLKALKGLDPIRVENRVGPGTPDINYIGGDLENKWLRRWPKVRGEVVLLDHYTPQQRVWHQRRWAAGGNVFLLLCVAATKEWLLFNGDVAAEVVGRVSQSRLYLEATAVWPSGLINKDLRECVTKFRIKIN